MRASVTAEDTSPTTSQEAWQLTASEALQLLNHHKMTVQEYTDALLAHIKSRDNDVKAFVYFDEDHIQREAARLDTWPQELRGPLHGIPIGIKDIMLTEDMPTQYNSRLYETSRVISTDAACVKTIRNNGALVFGKLSTTEFATTKQGDWHQNRTRNAHSMTHTPGGSSSGSAAAVAASLLPIALGTQTGGSIIRPASYNGCFGFKPTWNAISREGVAQWCITFDTVGFFTRSVDDLELLADVFRLPRKPTSTGFRVRGAKIAFCKTHNWHKASKALCDAMSIAQETLSGLGAETCELELPDAFGRSWAWHERIGASEGKVSFLSQYSDDPKLLHESICSYVEGDVSPRDILEAYDGFAALRPQFDKIASQYDVIITPSVPDEAPLGLESTGDMSFCLMWTALHAPTLNIPCYSGANGLPLGLTIVGPRLSDREVLQRGKVIHAALTDS